MASRKFRLLQHLSQPRVTITMQPPLPAATWEAEVNKMNKTFAQAFLRTARGKSFCTCKPTILSRTANSRVEMLLFTY